MVDPTIEHMNESDAVVDLAMIRAVHDRMDQPPVDADVSHRMAEIRALEELANAISARQARLTVDAHRRQAAADHARGIAPEVTQRLLGSQVALARRTSPHRGSRFVRLADDLSQHPRLAEAWAAGVTGESQALLVHRETRSIPRRQQTAVDTAIADELGRVSDRRLQAAARTAVYRTDPDGASDRHRAAALTRHVTMRPAPDGMAWLTATLPAQEALACYRSLRDATQPVVGRPVAGDPVACRPVAGATVAGRPVDDSAPAAATRDQAMADRLVELLTGRATTQGIGLHVDLLMPVDTLLGDEPAHLHGYGPIAAGTAREMVLAGDSRAEPPATGTFGPVGSAPSDTTDLPAWRRFVATALCEPGDPHRAGHRPEAQDDTRQFDQMEQPASRDHSRRGWDAADVQLFGPAARIEIRRLLTAPGSGDIVAMESRSRCYTGLLAHLIALRDQMCRTPWCGAAITHTDHIRPARNGGPTTERNGQGLCARCNYVKEHPDLSVSGHAGQTRISTAGLTAVGRPPAPPGLPPPTRSAAERTLMDALYRPGR